jgi:peptidoglycan/LPS O-acetylase OafA/YrhL
MCHAHYLCAPFHGMWLAEAGNFCVQMFFAVSGFSIALAWDRSNGPWPVRARKFWVRRILRIAPLYWLATGFYVAWLGFGAREFAPAGINRIEIALNLLFLHGWYPTAINSVVPGGWSIGVEMMFYAIFPLLASQLTTRGRLMGLFAVTMAIAWASHYFSATLYGPGISRLQLLFFYYWFPNQMAVFGLGLLAWRIWHDTVQSGKLHRTAARRLAILSGISLLLVARFGAGEFSHIVFGAASAALAVGGLAADFAPQGWARGLAFIGRMSFSFYLNHFWVLTLVRPLIDPIFPSMPDQPWGQILRWLGLCLLAATGTTIASLATYRWIEQPGIELARYLTRTTAATGEVPQPA